MLARDFAECVAADWIDSWNSHDLAWVLAHYAEDFEISSPKIIQIAGKPSGKAAVGAYWVKALQLIPDLKFELIPTLAGVNSLTLYYRGAKEQLAAEVFEFWPDMKVVRASAHYSI